MSTFKFEAKAFRMVTVEAADRAAARRIMDEVDMKGSGPAVGIPGVISDEDSMDDGTWHLVEVNGEPI